MNLMAREGLYEQLGLCKRHNVWNSLPDDLLDPECSVNTLTVAEDVFVLAVLMCLAAHYAVATRTDFLVRGVVRRRRAFRSLKVSSEEIGRNLHAHFARFPRTRFFCLSAKNASQNLGRGNRSV